MAGHNEENIPVTKSVDDKAPKGDSIESMLTCLHKEIKNSDWLKQNTAEKWMEENKDAANQFLKARESEAKGDNPGSKGDNPGS